MALLSVYTALLSVDMALLSVYLLWLVLSENIEPFWVYTDSFECIYGSFEC